MRIEHIQVGGQEALRIVLSERNLRALLSKLSMPDSACTIYTQGDDGAWVYISAERDGQHYDAP